MDRYMDMNADTDMEMDRDQDTDKDTDMETDTGLDMDIQRFGCQILDIGLKFNPIFKIMSASILLVLTSKVMISGSF